MANGYSRKYIQRAIKASRELQQGRWATHKQSLEAGPCQQTTKRNCPKVTPLLTNDGGRNTPPITTFAAGSGGGAVPIRRVTRSEAALVKTELNRFRGQIRLAVTAHRRSRWSAACESLDYRNGGKFWRKLKQLTGQASHSNSPIEHNNTVAHTNQEKALVFYGLMQEWHSLPPPSDQQFTNFIELSANMHSLLPFYNIPPHNEAPEHPLLLPITSDHVLGALARGKNSAPGPDNLSRKILRNLPDEAITSLVNIYNHCLNSGYFPSPWKEAHVVMIAKKTKPPRNPMSYRPISLLNVLGKTYERILADRLNEHAEDSSLIPNTQYGFRRQRSTTLPLLHLTTDVTAACNSKKTVTALLLDVEKAFDRVWKAGLIHKLVSSGIPPHFVRSIKSFLTSRNHRIKIKDSISDPFCPSAGVPQGSCLSPLLYNMYTKDIPLPPQHSHSSCIQYADDVACWASGRDSFESSRNLQTYLNSLQSWFQLWRIHTNPSKSQLIQFHHPHVRSPPHISLNHTTLTPTTSATYLGTIFTPTLNWKANTDNITSRMRARGRMLSMLRGNNWGCDPKVLVHTYKAFIRPVAEYHSLTISLSPHRTAMRLLTLERAILRKCLGLHYLHPSNQIHALASLPPISDRILLRMTHIGTKLTNEDIPGASELLRVPAGRPHTRPRKKLPYPPTVILRATPDLPPDLQQIMDTTEPVFSPARPPERG